MKQTYRITKHAYQRLQERYDETISIANAGRIAGKAFRNGKTFEEFIRINETVDRKKLSRIYRHLTKDRTVRMFKSRAWIFTVPNAEKKVNLITVLNLEGDN